MHYLKLARRSGVLAAFGFLLVAPSPARAEECRIEGDSIAGVRIGASKAEVIAQLSARYSVSEETKPYPKLIARAGVADGRPAMVIELNADRVFLIDSSEKCLTKKGIGPGVTLGRAQQVYGRARVDPTDSGYFIWFDRTPGVMFLLDDRDIPLALRDIPDDVISLRQERQILSLRKARLEMTRVSAQ